jgi:hypothetical protein
MSAITFELKKEHLLLLKNLRWSVNKDNIICNVADEGDGMAPPFGEVNLYEAIDLIFNGKPENVDPLTHEDFPEYSNEQKAEWDKLYSELPMALDVILYHGTFEVGIYKTKFHLRDWKKIK